MCENLCIFIAFVSVALHSQVWSVVIFNGLIYLDWPEQIQFHLGVLDLDLALLTERPTTITDENKAEERSLYRAWKRSNGLSLMFIQMMIANNRSIIPRIESDEEYMEFLKEHSQSKSVDKSRVGALMHTLTTYKFDCTCTMHQHVTKMIDIA